MARCAPVISVCHLAARPAMRFNSSLRKRAPGGIAIEFKSTATAFVSRLCLQHAKRGILWEPVGSPACGHV